MIHDEHETLEMDLRLKLGGSMLVAGGSGTGKSRLLMTLLGEAPKYLNPVPKKVVVFYETYQADIYDKLIVDCAKFGCTVVFEKTLVISVDFVKETRDVGGGHTIYLYDDGAIRVLREDSVALLLTHSRHLNVTIIFATHTVFLNSNAARIAGQQMTYYIFLKSPRMAGQIAHLARQLGKSVGKTVVDAYNDIQRRGSFGHILVDCTPDSVIPVRSDILSDSPVAHRNA